MTSKCVSETEEYGSWSSPIDAGVVSGGNCKEIYELHCNEKSVFWIEQQFPTGRRSIFQQYLDEECIVEWTPSRFNVRNTVHEYGGGTFIVVGNGIIFSSPDGIFRQESPDSAPEQIVAGDRFHRYADMCFHDSSVYVVYEIHSGDETENMIVRIEKNGLQQVMVAGADFYAYPRVSPDGHAISWMEWNLPNMPWNETSVIVARLTENKVGDRILELRREGTNFICPEWDFNSELFVISDMSNWWNVYSVNFAEKSLGENIYPVEAEIGGPMWQFADRHYVTNEKGILMNVFGELKYRNWSGEVVSVVSPDYSTFRSLTLNENNVAYAIASGPRKASSVIKIDISTSEITVLREARSSTEINKYHISVPNSLTFHSDGCEVQGWYYPPYSKSHKAPECSLPPVVLMAHGGPTAYSPNTLNMKVQYLTTRGFGVFDVNYRGSTGFGTVYRNSLLRQWGVVDRNDMINAAKCLVKLRLADPKRLCIMGSSAGGYLLLSAVMHSSLFAAAASLYGVSDLIGLVKDTHKFERGYNEQLIGKYPEELVVYQERSPLYHTSQLTTPVAFFHGEEDPIVPLSQSVELHNALKAKGVLTALTIYPGEGHGFKSSNANIDTLNGLYCFFCKVLGIKSSVQSEIKIINLATENSAV